MTVPVWPEAGVSVKVRMAPEPPNAMPLSGSSPMFEDARLTVRLAAEVSASPMVKLIGPREVSCGMVWFETSEMVGGVLAAIVTVKLVELVNSPSETTTVIRVTPD